MSTEQNTDKAGGLWSVDPAEREAFAQPQPQHSALVRAEVALQGESNDEEHDALFELVEVHKVLVNHAEKLAEALREAITEYGVLTDNMPEYRRKDWDKALAAYEEAQS